MTLKHVRVIQYQLHVQLHAQVHAQVHVTLPHPGTSVSEGIRNSELSIPMRHYIMGCHFVLKTVP